VETARQLCALLTAEALLAEHAGESKRALGLFGEATDAWRDYGRVPEMGFNLLDAGKVAIQLEDAPARVHGSLPRPTSLGARMQNHYLRKHRTT
jgi:hypothetical protein